MNKFPKQERLSSRKQIEELFKKGESFTLYPIKTVYLKKPQAANNSHQVLVTVPKRNFKKAVERNKLKRRIKEAYRLNKQQLDSQSREFYLVIGYIYVGRKIADYQLIADKLKQSLERLREVVQ